MPELPPMSWLQLTEAMTGHFVWPLVVLISAFLLLRRMMASITSRLLELSFGGATMARIILAVWVLMPCGSVRAQRGPEPPSSLPPIDWVCYASSTVSFAPPGDKFQQLGLDGDNLKKPRLELHVLASGAIFKVIENPAIPEIRKEYRVELSNMTQDFARNNPVYAWREEKGFQVTIYTFNVNDKIVSRTRVMKPDARALDKTEVMVCR
jgi:hypothetical protein